MQYRYHDSFGVDHLMTVTFTKNAAANTWDWTAEVGTSNELTYFLVWESLAEREEKWGKFQSDPEWIEKRAQTEANGPIVARVRNSFLRPTSYSSVQ